MQRKTANKEAWRPKYTAPRLVHDSDIYARYAYVRTTSMYTTRYTRRKTKNKQPLRSGLGMDMCKRSGSICEYGVRIWTFVRKTRHPPLLPFMGVIMTRNTW